MSHNDHIHPSLVWKNISEHPQKRETIRNQIVGQTAKRSTVYVIPLENHFILFILESQVGKANVFPVTQITHGVSRNNLRGITLTEDYSSRIPTERDVIVK